MKAFGAWAVGKTDDAAAEAIWRSGCCRRLTAALLASRGIRTPEEAAEFLREDAGLLHDPMAMKDMDKAVARIRLAVERKETVAVYGDYDVDGITATALLCSWFKRQGLRCIPYIPERLTEGYGVSEEALEGLAQQGVTLMVTVDCGVTAVSQICRAAELGVDVVVTDHHECVGDLPPAAAVVDPHRKDDDYPFKGLAGVGVAFKVVSALEGPEATEALLDRYGALTALGTIADIMPVVGENRALIRRGVWLLRTREYAGLDSLMAAIYVDKRRLSGSDISFSVVPKLNAAGRMGRVKVAFDLLMAEDRREAQCLAGELCTMNAERRSVEDRVYREALAMLGELRRPDAPIVLASENWHHGVSGIVASRLAERFGVPAVIICLEGEEGRGSCRSYGSFGILGALDAARDELTSYGGHELAAGLTIRRDRVDALRRRLADYYRSHEGERAQLRIPIDFCVEDPSLLTLEEIDALKLMSPWGVGNPAPALCMRDVIAEALIPIGGDRHLKLVAVKNGWRFDCVFFGVSVRELGIHPGSLVDLAFDPGINDFRGSRTVQLLLRDVRPSRMRGDPSVDMARRFFAGQRLLPMENAMLLPNRADLGRVWRYLTGRARCFEEEADTLLPDIALRAGVPVPGRVWVCLRVLDELKLIRLREADGVMEITVPRVEGKADLSKSELLQRLR
ncbi:MAG: single-stranded-DNA-specific exonuclease RecJ [Oscillospiraceae bacterium]|nr:single-stranded-DNA-specific exonuclease RecJ [Oscillospiraceae bacterium]